MSAANFPVQPQPIENPGDNTDVNTDAVGDEWARSIEYRAVRRARVAALTVTVVLAAAAVGYLVKTNYDAGNSLKTGSMVSQLENEIGGARTDLEAARLRLSSAQNDADNSERYPSLYGTLSPDDIEDIAKARDEVATANVRYQVATDEYNAAERERARLLDRQESSRGLWWMFALALAVVIAILTATLRYVREEKRREFDNRIIISRTATAGAQDGSLLELETLWRYNRNQLQRYHQLVLNYATSARKTTQITLSVSFAFLLAVGTLAFFAKSVPSAVASSIVVAAGATVTGFVARAVLRNAETSTQEVSAFFTHPLEVERILAAERVISAMPESSREAAQLLMVQALTRTSDQDPASATVSTHPGTYFIPWGAMFGAGGEGTQPLASSSRRPAPDPDANGHPR